MIMSITAAACLQRAGYAEIGYAFISYATGRKLHHVHPKE